MKVIPFNPMPDGTCRTIKAQYQQSSMANFVRGGAYAATGVIETNDVQKECQADRRVP